MMTQTLTLGHSPDSDDAFMFYALAAGKVGDGALAYEHILKDIQTLNEWAREGRLDTTAISVHAYAYVADKYAILNHGASMGERDYGPMVVARESLPARELRGKTIAVPGLMTSAYLALRLCIGEFTANVLGGNHKMIEVLVSSGFEVHPTLDSGTTHLSFQIHASGGHC